MRTTVNAPAIDHLGWAVRSIDASRSHFESSLGLDLQSDERFPDVRVAFFGQGPTRAELLEPLSPESDMARSIARRGEGLDKAPRPGARCTMVGVVDPQRQEGVLVEYAQGPMAT